MQMNLILGKVFRFWVLLCLFVGFMIINDGGFVAVRGENGTVFRTDVPVASLPRSDAEKIGAGIACKDASELAAVLENYIS